MQKSDDVTEKLEQIKKILKTLKEEDLEKVKEQYGEVLREISPMEMMERSEE